MPTSPSTDNYFIGKGIVTFKEKGAVTFRDLGNVSSFTFTPQPEFLEHFSSRIGVKLKDKEVVIEMTGTVSITMDEFTAENLAMASLGDVDSDSDGNLVVEIMSRNVFEGELKLTGTNNVGQQVDAHFFNVAFKGGNEVQLITDEWGNIEIEGEVLANELGRFGTWTVREQSP